MRRALLMGQADASERRWLGAQSPMLHDGSRAMPRVLVAMLPHQVRGKVEHGCSQCSKLLGGPLDLEHLQLEDEHVAGLATAHRAPHPDQASVSCMRARGPASRLQGWWAVSWRNGGRVHEQAEVGARVTGRPASRKGEQTRAVAGAGRQVHGRWLAAWEADKP